MSARACGLLGFLAVLVVALCTSGCDAAKSDTGIDRAAQARFEYRMCMADTDNDPKWCEYHLNQVIESLMNGDAVQS